MKPKNINFHSKDGTKLLWSRCRNRGNFELVISLSSEGITKTKANLLVKGVERLIRETALGPVLKFQTRIKEKQPTKKDIQTMCARLGSKKATRTVLSLEEFLRQHRNKLKKKR